MHLLDEYVRCCEKRVSQCAPTSHLLFPDHSTKNLVEVPTNRAENVICPDKTASCDEGDTCCLTTHDRYGCCPLPQAVCCSDKLHCCPHGTRCDVKHNRCVKAGFGTIDFTGE
ncbi:Granulin [Trichuris trichiura]|uniref:Granulin n=1 Tax=Trichuris trichiura TaxID=36087 RepID=A0A077Z6X9_TRITR|nr:Granulin [Trichuris trichiura]